MNYGNTASTYLKRLKFNPKLQASFIAGYFLNFRIIILILLTIIAFGIQSYLALPRNLNPEIKIPIVIVSTILPGAGPADVESLITIPIEDAVRGVSNVKKVTSSAQESVSVVQIEFESGVDPEKAKSDIQSAVDGVTELPSEAQTPKVLKLDFENQPIWVFALSGQHDKGSLIRFAQDLKKNLEDLPSIDKVELTGLDEQEIQIVIKPEAVSSYGLNPQQLTAAIKNALSSFPAGILKTSGNSFSLTIDQTATELNDLRTLKLNLGQNIISLQDVAQIKEISKPDQNEAYILDQDDFEPSITFNVFRLKSVNFDKANADANRVVDQKLSQSGKGFKVSTVVNAAEQIQKEFNDLQRDISITVGLMFLVLFMFLGIRQALVSMLSVPLTFLITFIVMKFTGIALSFIATFSLLLSLGLLVDDTIVVISAMTSYFRTGKFTPLQTALLVWKDFFIAILTTTITTVWAFIPLLLSSGIIGEFIKPIPIVVSSTLLGSIFVSLMITIPVMIFLLKPYVPTRVIVLIRLLFLGLILGLFYLVLPKSNIILVEILALLIFLLVTYQIRTRINDVVIEKMPWRINPIVKQRIKDSLNKGLVSFNLIEHTYAGLIRRILNSKSARRRAVIMVVIFSIFSYSLVPFGLVKNEFFPKTDEDNLYVSVELPPGTNLQTSKKQALLLFDKLKNIAESQFVTLDLGQGFSSMQGVSSAGQNSFLYSIALKKKEDRNQTSDVIAQEIRNNFADFTFGKVSVIEVSGGPPAGADLQIKLFGPELKTLDQYAAQIQGYLKNQSGVTNIDKSIKPGTSKVVFEPDGAKLAQNNLTSDQLGFWLRIFANGFKADEFKHPGAEITQDVTMRFGSTTQNVEDISRINIPTPSGGIVPLEGLGILLLENSPTLITREDGKRTLSVSASVTKGFNVADLNKKLETFASTLNLPAGYGWATGGVNEENQKSVNSILQAMVLSFMLIIITMVLQFVSFRKAFIVMLVIPLSISGVFIIFALTQTPLSFPALIGILALFGIVVKNSILVVDKILINQKSNMEFSESVVDAAVSRLEPIALTSITAIVGLVPITIANPLWRGLGGAIIAGLTFSGTIMLFFIPVVYYLMFNPENKGLKNGNKEN